MTRRERWIVVLSVLAVAVAAFPWALPLVWRAAVARAEASAPARGRLVAERLGCFSCHGPGGTGGVPDPGSPDPVPAFTGGVPWQYAEGVEELENWILHGDPKGRGEIRKQHGKETHATPASSPEPTETHAAAEEIGHEHKGLMKMPAFRDHVTDEELADLIAFVLALSPKDMLADEPVRRGLDLASRNGCFACHGPMGSGGIANVRSLKGYIPGFFGSDLRELAKDRAEVEAWIRDGNVTRLARNPAAKLFLDRQPIMMPAFGKHLSDAEIADLVAMVEWIHEDGHRR